MAECHSEKYFPINSLPLEVLELIRAASDPATLLQWSSTCRFYRNLLGPHVFQSITIGPKLSPTRVLEALSRNDRVKSLTFTCEADRHSRQAKADSTATGNEGPRSPKELFNSDLLGQILRQLPTNLATLTLRFPENWTAQDNICWPRQFAFEDEQPLTDRERHDLHNDILWTTLDCMAKNDISNKQDFHLQIYNMTPHVSGVYHQPSLRNFLRQVTSFTLALCKFERHRGQRPLEKTWYRYLLSGWFYEQLHRAETFNLSAEPIWLDTSVFPLTDVYSTLAPKPEHFPNLRHLSLSGIFIDPELIAFLTSKTHAQNIQSISLHDCFCHATTRDYGTPSWLVEFEDASTFPTWSTLFDSLSAAKPAKLTSFTISYHPWHLLHRMPCYYESNHDSAFCTRHYSPITSRVCNTIMAAAALDGECGERSRLAGVPCEEHFHRSLMLLYSNLNPKFTPGGATAHYLWGKADTCNRFVDGTDIESWKRLANLMVANGGRNLQMY